MIDLEYSGKIYKLPTKFSEITLDKYMEIIDIQKVDKPVDKLVYMLSILSGLSVEQIKSISMDQIGAINNHLTFIFKSGAHLLIDQIKIDGKWYGFNKRINDISFGEYIDLEQFSSGEGTEKNLHILMAILYRPLKQKKKSSTLNNFIGNYIYKKEKIVKDYEIEGYEPEKVIERAELFKKKMTVDVVLGAMFFFTILKRIYINNSKHSLTKKEMMKEVIKYMEASGVSFKPTGDG